MCYYLYGSINDGINLPDYDKVASNYNYHFNIGDVKTVEDCVKNTGDEYRITSNYCDCDTALVQKHTNK